jgi:hypothetical protein
MTVNIGLRSPSPNVTLESFFSVFVRRLLVPQMFFMTFNDLFALKFLLQNAQRRIDALSFP